MTREEMLMKGETKTVGTEDPFSVGCSLEGSQFTDSLPLHPLLPHQLTSRPLSRHRQSLLSACHFQPHRPPDVFTVSSVNMSKPRQDWLL